MKILVLNGSPRPQGDTAKMVAVFRETAESAGSALMMMLISSVTVNQTTIQVHIIPLTEIPAHV